MKILIRKVFARIKFILANRNYATKRAYLRKQGATIGENTNLNCYTSAFGTEPYLITIGDNCLLAGGVEFFTHDGGVMVLNNLNYFADKKMDKIAPIKIGNNVYFGQNAMVLPGVTIGDNVIIGAGAVVTRDIPDNVVAVGIPAKVIKSIDEYYAKAKEENLFYPTLHLNPEQKRKYFSKNKDTSEN